MIEDKFYDIRQGQGSLDQVGDVFNARDGLNAPGWFDALINTNSQEETNDREGYSEDFEHRNRFATTDDSRRTNAPVEVESSKRFQHQADSRRTNAPTYVGPSNGFKDQSGFVSLSDSRRTNAPVEVKSYNRFQHQADPRGTNPPTTVESSDGFQHRSGLINLDWEDEGVYSKNRFDSPYLYDENRVDLEDRYGYSKEKEDEMPEFSSILQANTGTQTGSYYTPLKELLSFLFDLSKTF